MRLFARLISDPSGGTAVEYTVIACLISVTIIAAANTMSGKVSGQYDMISDKLEVLGETDPVSGG